MRISDWSSDVCSSDLLPNYHGWYVAIWAAGPALLLLAAWSFVQPSLVTADILSSYSAAERPQTDIERQALLAEINGLVSGSIEAAFDPRADQGVEVYEASSARWRSEEHTSELQSLMRISYAVFCLKKKK